MKQKQQIETKVTEKNRMKDDYVCPCCKGKLIFSKTTVVCTNCNSKYDVKESILDLFCCNSLTSDKREYSIEFNSKGLYKESKGLETRIRYFRTRFRHNLECSRIVSYLNHHSPRVLEVGCGTMEPLLPVGSDYDSNQRIWGVDLSWTLLLCARTNSPNTKLCRANASIMPFRNQFFDLIWARHMLYHVSKPVVVLKECQRCLKQSGVFCLSTNSKANKPEMHEFHIQLLRKYGIEIAYSSRGSERFPAEEAGERVRPFFQHVIEVPYKGSFEFLSSNEFMDYYVTTAYFKKAVSSGIDKVKLIRKVTSMLKEKPLLRLSNNGAVVFATNSLSQYKEMKKLI